MAGSKSYPFPELVGEEILTPEAVLLEFVVERLSR